MGEILGLGMGHYPGFLFDDAAMSDIGNRMKAGKIDSRFADPATWPAQMRAEWGDDDGETFAAIHREEFMEGARRVRAALDAFEPDAVIIFGEDRYESFREDLVAPFAVLIQDEFVARPFTWGRGGGVKKSYWGDDPAYELRFPGAKAVAASLVSELIENHFDIAYSYRPRHGDAVSHSFANTILYLDQERTGWPYGVIPFHVNSYGTSMVRSGVSDTDVLAGPPDPPPPTPKRAFALGRAVADYVLDSPWKVALIGSSSWSHGVSVPAHGGLYPDVDADQERFNELRTGQYAKWQDLTTEQLHAAGETEILNWLPLVGAMSAAGAGAPAYCTMHESYLMSSSKCTAIFEPVGR